MRKKENQQYNTKIILYNIKTTFNVKITKTKYIYKNLTYILYS